MRRLDWFIARRYLASRKKGRFLSFITWIALGGITLGVMALIVVLGVMTGMQEELRGRILGSTPHLTVLEYGDALRMGNWRSLMEDLSAMEEVESATPFVLTKVGLTRGGGGGEDYAQTADLYGVSLEEGDLPVTEMEEEIREGIHDLRGGDGALPPIILGSRLADRMRIIAGDTVRLISLEEMGEGPQGELYPSIREFEVTGTFTTGMYDYDVGNMYAALEDVQDLLRIREEGQVSGLGLRIPDPWRASEVGSSIRDELGGPYHVESWITQNRALFAALQLEKIAMTVILFLIVVVAAFNIVGTLVMVVVDRTREIGILKSMGMTDGQVLRIFLMQGAWIGVLGTLVGALLGMVLGWVIHRYELISIPPDVYFVERLPVSLNPLDIGLIVGATVLISLLATIYPALQASRLQPVEAIRHE